MTKGARLARVNAGTTGDCAVDWDLDLSKSPTTAGQEPQSVGGFNGSPAGINYIWPSPLNKKCGKERPM